MEILTIEPSAKSGKTRVVFGNGTTLFLYKSEVKKYDLKQGKIEDSVYDSLIEDTIRPRCRTRALHLISKMDRTEADVRQKLREGGYPEDIIDDTMAFMEEYHYVDDLEYAKAYFRTYGESKSLKVIAAKLMEKGLSKEIIREAGAEAYTGSEEELIRRLLEKRHYDPETADRKERAKTARYLMGKGFSYDKFSDLL